MRKPTEKAKFLLENPNAIREIMSLIEEYNRNPRKFKRKLIYLAGGWPQDPPPEFLREAIEEILRDEKKFARAVQYGPTRGLSETISSIVDYEEAIFHRKIKEENLIIGNGSTELTAALLNALLDEKGEIILSRPHYLNYYRQAQLTSNLKAKVKYWNLIRESDLKFEPSIEELKEIITDKTALILLTSPGNPDGQVFSDELFRAVSEIAKDKNIFLAVDLAYRGFCYSEDPYYFSKEVEEHEIFICTFSKELRLPGFRLGYVIASKEVIRWLEVVEQASDLCPNNLAQKIISELFSRKENLKNIAEFIVKGKELYRKTAEFSYLEMKRKIPEFSLLEPKGAFYLFFNHSGFMKDSRKFCSKLLNEYQVALAPGVDFGLEGWTRLSVSPGVLDNSLIKEGIERISEFVQKADQKHL